MKKYIAVVIASYKRTMEHRANMVVSNFQSIFALFILFYFWRGVYGERESLNGYTFPQIVTYYFLMRVSFSRTSTFGADGLAKSIKTGEITRDLIKPLNYILFFVSRYFVITLIWTIGNLISILLFSYFLYSVLIVPTVTNFLFYLLVFAINGALAILINLIIGSIGFWTTEVTHIKTIASHILSLLSGGLIPFVFFPDWAQSILNVLPFRFLVQLPADVFLGKLTINEIGTNILILIAWVAALYFLAHLIFKKGLNGYESYN